MHTCSICKKKFAEFPNRAWPINQDGECCDECDCLVVIPARCRDMGYNDEQADAIGKAELESRLRKKAALKEAHHCTQCGVLLSPLDYMMGSVCGPCCRANHRKATHT